MASRSLALAILERTLEVHLVEEAESALLQKDEAAKNDCNDENKDKERDKRRFELFFAAGGLRILNQWLIDAASHETTKSTNYVTTSNRKNEKSSATIRGKNSNKNENATTALVIRKPHATRPIALSILLFLEHIPFEKKTVTNSKINKQIQKLGKKIALIKEDHQNGKSPKEDIENWTTQESVAHSEALARILFAVDAVKASWRVKAKIKGEKKQLNPFDTLQSKIKERLEVLNQFESGALSTRPEWYRPVVTASVKRKAPPLKRKAMNEAEIEKLKIQKKIKQVQSRNQKSLQQLKEKLRRRKVEKSHTHSGGAPNSVSSFSSNKKVTWKDGLRTQVTRNRQMLEEVFVFGSDLPVGEKIV